MTRAVAVALACATAAAVVDPACVEHVEIGTGSGSGSGSNPIPDLVAIAIAPADSIISVTLSDPPQPVPFSATGRFADGDTRDITSLVTWSADAAAAGAFGSDAGVYATTNAAGAHVNITAASGAISATTTLTVIASATVFDPEFPPAAGADALFGSDVPVVIGDPNHAPQLQYPSDGTRFPQDLAQILVQYAAGMANDTVRISFDSDVLHIVVYTAAIDCWLPDATLWSSIELSGSAAPVSLAVEAAGSAAPGTAYGAPPATLTFTPTAAAGRIDYWSKATNGIMQARLSASTAGKLYPTPGDATCAGCHAASRSGRAIATGYGNNEMMPVLQTVAAASLATEIPATAKLPMGWATFSPSDDRVLVASNGVLTLYDAATGAPVGPANGVVPLPSPATHPDWSPDGTHVAVALLPMMPMPTNLDVQGGSIAVIEYQDGNWGTPTILVASANKNDNNYFPKWSPDGRLIAYVHADSSSRGAPTAELRLVPATGGTPIALAVASHRVGSVDGVPNLADTMPTWAPQQGDTAWLAFASTRNYGKIRPGASQIWIAGIDLAKSGDPSFAAFWLPSQVVTVLNNNPVWASVPEPVN